MTLANVLTLILLALAFLMFVLAAVGVAARVNLLASGLALYVLARLLERILKS